MQSLVNSIYIQIPMQPPSRVRKQTLSTPQRPPGYHVPKQPFPVLPGPINVFGFYGNYTICFFIVLPLEIYH